MISCSHYDYIEIVCLYRYPVNLALKSGDDIEGIAHNTKRDTNGNECIELLIDGKSVLVVLDDIFKLNVLVDNPHFSEKLL